MQSDRSRRAFMKAAGFGAAVFATQSTHSVLAQGSGAARANPGSAWEDGKQINPDIDNLRVACCHDPRMIMVVPKESNFKAQNGAINVERVHANLDAMAQTLARKKNAKEAWNVIFQKSPEKQWKEVTAAIKVNCINTSNMVRIAIVEKVCLALNTVGVPFGNITVYDACHDAFGKYDAYLGKGLPAAVKIHQEIGTGPKIELEYSTVPCSQLIARKVNNTIVYPIDILVNCAVNKGHGQRSNNGGVTLTMKNHIGTMKFSCPSLNQIVDINKSYAIIGGTPVRQQLCIVDSLLASVDGPMGKPDSAPCRLVMGTFGPAVDYLTVKKIREPVMGAKHENGLIERYLTEFGYNKNQFGNLDMIPVQPA